MASNLIDITSPEHFKDVLSKDLKRVSCLNFWAPWAEPCEAFNKEIATAAGKYPTILFLNVSICTDSLIHSVPIGLYPLRLVLELMHSALGSNTSTFQQLSTRINQIEAESLPDISESFDIEAVPSVLLLRVSVLLFFLRYVIIPAPS